MDNSKTPLEEIRTLIVEINESLKHLVDISDEAFAMQKEQYGIPEESPPPINHFLDRLKRGERDNV